MAFCMVLSMYDVLKSTICPVPVNVESKEYCATHPVVFDPAAEEAARSWGESTVSTLHEDGPGRNGLFRKFHRVLTWLTECKKNLLSGEGPEIMSDSGHFGLDDARREQVHRLLPDSDPDSVAGKKRLRLEQGASWREGTSRSRSDVGEEPGISREHHVYEH